MLHIQSFMLLIRNQFDTSAKMVHNDNGGEFLNETCRLLFQNLGVIHQTSCSFTPQQNGRVERKHRQLLNIARALRIQALVPIRYWRYCVLTTCYLDNLLSSRVRNGKSPYFV